MSQSIKLNISVPERHDEKLIEQLKALTAQSGKQVQKWAQEVKTATASVKRSLMGFDQLNRLVAKSSGKSSAKENKSAELLKDMASGKALVIGPALGLISQLVDVTGQAQDKMGALQGAFSAISVAATGAVTGFANMQNATGNMVPVMEQATNATQTLNNRIGILNGGMFSVANGAQEGAAGLKNAFSGLGDWFKGNVDLPVQKSVNSLFDGLVPNARQAWSGIKGVFGDASGYFTHTFGTAWKDVMGIFKDGGDVFVGIRDGVLSGFRSAVNGLIGGINDVVSTPFSGIKGALESLKNYRINGTSPFKNLNFSITMPKIPFLAQGAVLPANKPFLAMVGDQKHGTNIEAPLSTIEQAVSAVLQDQLQAQLAGSNATVEVLQQILAAVLGISIDDGMLSRAVERHQNKMALMTGGF